MALINCPECGREVSDKAVACIHCGYPIASIQSSVADEPASADIQALVNEADELQKISKHAEALVLYEKAARLGNRMAQLCAGNIYRGGLGGVPKDYAKALYWFELAAKQGSKAALRNIGNMYKNGTGVEKSVAKAEEYFSLASGEGVLTEMHIPEPVVTEHNVSTHDIEHISSADTLELVQKADELRASKKYADALSLYETAALRGDVHSQIWAGNFYDRGLGVAVDYEKARYWFEMAAKQNSATANNNLGAMYENGHGVAKDGSKALAYYLLASEAGNGYASKNIASMYDFGNVVPKNYTLALKYYELALTQGNQDPTILNNLGVLYMDGKGTDKNYRKAEELLSLAAQKGNEQAKKNLALLRNTMQNKAANTQQENSSGKGFIGWVIAWGIITAGVMFFLTDGFSDSALLWLVLPLGFAVALIEWLLHSFFTSDPDELKKEWDREKYNYYRYTCPQCKSKKVIKIGAVNRGFSVYLFGLASSKIGKQYKCDNCGHMW